MSKDHVPSISGFGTFRDLFYSQVVAGFSILNEFFFLEYRIYSLKYKDIDDLFAALL